MYNLLASIIAVAIGVFMTSAGLYYGGAAYSTSSAKAQAMQIIASMEQIDSAWTIWSNDGNTTTGALPAYTGATGLTSAPYYLSAVPTPPSTAVAWSQGGAAAYVLDTWGSGSTNGGGAAPATETSNTGIALLLNKSTGGNACLEMAKAAGVMGLTTSSTTFPAAAQPLPTPGGGAPTNVTLSGITTKAEFDALAYNYRFFCVQTAGTWGGANLSFGNSGNTTFTAGGVGDANTYIAFFKHQ
ncbi:hypothetical protein [Azospirillum sp. sgz302134]